MLIFNQKHQLRNYLYGLLILILVILESYQLYRGYHPQSIPWDTQHSYLVAAQHFIEQGFSFFATEESLRYPPLTFLIYVPFLDHLETVRLLNNVFSLASLWFVYQTLRLFSSKWSATLGLLIYVTIPNLSQHWGQLMTEPLFLFFSVVWLWATTKSISSEKKSFIVLAILSLTLATLTRAVYLYFIYFIILSAVIWLILAPQLPHRNAVKKLLIICLGAFCFLALFMLKNWIFFDSFTIANGMSGALYQGLHPFFGGIAPPVNGNDYDINALTLDHLSILGEQRNMLASKVILSERSLSEHLVFFLNKSYLVFFDYQQAISRYWRLAILPFFCCTLWFSRPKKDQTLAQFIFFFFGLLLIYQFAILLPILVLERYTTASTAIPMAICGGYSYWFIWKKGSLKLLISLHIIALLLTLGGFFEARQYKQYFPTINSRAYEYALTLSKAQLADQKDNGAYFVKDNTIAIKKSPANIIITMKNIASKGNNTLLLLNLSLDKGKCRGKQYLTTYANTTQQTLFNRPFSLHRGENEIRVGFLARSNQKDLLINLKLSCDNNSLIHYNGIQGYYDLTPSYLINKINQ